MNTPVEGPTLGEGQSQNQTWVTIYKKVSHLKVLKNQAVLLNVIELRKNCCEAEEEKAPM